MREAVTIAMPACVPDHPPRVTWPEKNLIQGVCPRCLWHEGEDGTKAVRALRARELIRQRG